METIWAVVKDVSKTLFDWHNLIGGIVVGVAGALYMIIRYPHGELKKEKNGSHQSPTE